MGENTHPVESTVEDVERRGQSSSTTVDNQHHPDDPITAPTAADNTTTALSELDQDSRPSTPRFIQDEGTWKHLKWVPYPLRRFLKATARWSRGPSSGIPRRFRIDPVFPAAQHLPLRLLDRYVPKRRPYRAALAFLWLGLWLMTFALVMRRGLRATEIQGWGEPSDIGCGTSYWVRGNGCGVDGNDCRPFAGSGFAFRCPASCLSYRVLNPRAVGDQEIIYAPMIVGGPANDTTAAAARPIYRGDSYICAAAIHAGLVSNSKGGCGVVTLVGQHADYVASSRNGATSFPFDSYFPLSFTFEPAISCSAHDMRWPLLGISVFFSLVFALFVSSPALFFFATFSGIFLHVGLASDPPPHATVPALLSNLCGKYLPAMLAAWVMYDRMGVRRSLAGLTAQFEKAFFWLGACWFGALENVSFSWIPLSRLTPHDLQQQPGAKAALAFIVVIICCVAASQIWYFRQEARLRRMLRLYVLMGAGLLLCLPLPDLKLRIHHYILALLFLPGTGMQTRPSLLYQGLLVGLFLNGIARWGWDPLLQTAYALQGDSQTGSPLPGVREPPAIALGANSSSITFTWAGPPEGLRYDGLSVLVNDVERFRTFFADGDDAFSAAGKMGGSGPDRFVWTRDAGAEVREYFRFAYMSGSQSADYTRAGVWDEKGEWVDMKPGPSRVKGRRSLSGVVVRRRRGGGDGVGVDDDDGDGDGGGGWR